jgi:hypothetical protein
MGKEDAKLAGGKAKDIVADDRNWVDRVENELNCTNNWNSQWGFLAGGVGKLNPNKATAKFSVDDQIE